MWAVISGEERHEGWAGAGGNGATAGKQAQHPTLQQPVKWSPRDKTLIPRSPHITRTYKILSNPTEQHTTIRIYVSVAILREAGVSVHTHTHTRADNSDDLSPPRSCRFLEALGKAPKPPQTPRRRVQGRQALEPEGFSKWKAFSHTETIRYTLTLLEELAFLLLTCQV